MVDLVVAPVDLDLEAPAALVENLGVVPRIVGPAGEVGWDAPTWPVENFLLPRINGPAGEVGWDAPAWPVENVVIAPGPAPAGNLDLAGGASTLARLRSWLVEPAAAATVPVARPTFVVTVVPVGVIPDTLTVTVQYADDAAFTAPTTLTATVAAALGYNVVNVPAGADLPAGAWWWRANVGGAWTAAQTFTVAPGAGVATAPLSWTVTAAAPRPRIWHLDPPVARPGDTVTVVGVGFGDAPTVTVGGLPAAVTNVAHVAATGQAAGSGRRIDPDGGPVDPAHDELLVVLPAVQPPGGALLVERG